MQLTDLLVPPGLFALTIILLGLVALPWVIKGYRASVARLLARWARENGVEIVKGYQLLWVGMPAIGFRVAFRTASGELRSGVLKFPKKRRSPIPLDDKGNMKYEFFPFASPIDSNQLP